MKQNWNTALREFSASNVNVPVSKKNFLGIFIPVWKKTSVASYATEGFRKAGIIPFDPEALDYSKLISERVVQAQDSLDNVRSQ